MIQQQQVASVDRFGRLASASRHPLVLLLAGSMLGSVLIPWVSGRMERTRHLNELRAQYSTTTLRTSWDVDRKLNLVVTAFDLFHKDEMEGRIPTTEAREAFRKEVDSLYRDFDRDAWWWHWQILHEARVLKLAPSERLDEFGHFANEYNATLVSATGEIDRLWTEMIRRPGSVPLEQRDATLKEVKRRLTELQNNRRDLVRQMVNVFID